MWRPEAVVQTLAARGELWEAAPGLVGMRGEVLALYRALEQALARLSATETADDWQVPPGIDLATLARAGYFASFPQWLTAVAHLSGDSDVLEWIATDPDPAAAARRALGTADAALAPAVCYHIYERLAGRTISHPALVTAQGTCWRHEGTRLSALERNWAFTMREIVCLGERSHVEAFRQRGMRAAAALAGALGLDCRMVQASDPFFAPTAGARRCWSSSKRSSTSSSCPSGGLEDRRPRRSTITRRSSAKRSPSGSRPARPRRPRA